MERNTRSIKNTDLQSKHAKEKWWPACGGGGDGGDGGSCGGG